MTCIIATSSFMCADRRVTNDGASSSMTKVAKNRWIIGAAAGNAVCSMAVVRAIRKGAQTPEDLIEHVDAESSALVLTPDGVIWQINEGDLWKPNQKADPVQAIGSGADLALGFICGMCSWDRPRAASPSLARRAQRFVAGRRVDCGGGCNVRFFS